MTHWMILRKFIWFDPFRGIVLLRKEVSIKRSAGIISTRVRTFLNTKVTVAAKYISTIFKSVCPYI